MRLRSAKSTRFTSDSAGHDDHAQNPPWKNIINSVPLLCPDGSGNSEVDGGVAAPLASAQWPVVVFKLEHAIMMGKYIDCMLQDNGDLFKLVPLTRDVHCLRVALHFHEL